MMQTPQNFEPLQTPLNPFELYVYYNVKKIIKLEIKLRHPSIINKMPGGKQRNRPSGYSIHAALRRHDQHGRYRALRSGRCDLYCANAAKSFEYG